MPTDSILSNPPFRTFARGDRITVDMASEDWPDCVVYPHGKTGTVLEVVGNVAVIAIDGFGDEGNCNVQVRFLKGINQDSERTL